MSKTRRRLSWALTGQRSGACGGLCDNIPMRETILGLTQWFNTDSGFEFNMLFNTYATVGRNNSRALTWILVVKFAPASAALSFALNLESRRMVD
jgi:hypothetical protein